MMNRMKIVSGIVAITLSLVLILLFLGASPAAAAPQTQEDVPFPDPVEALQAAIDWLVGTHQNSDGGYTSFSFGSDQGPSDIGGTIDALLAIGSAGADLFSPVSYLIDNLDDLTTYAGQDGSTAGKTVLALTAAGEDPADFEGNNYVLTLTGHLSPTGQFKVNTAFNQSLAMLGLAAAGEAVPDSAAEWLLSLQAADGDLAGSWDDGFGTPGNADSTAMSIMALIAAGRGGDESVTAALDFLDRTQMPSGGWEYGLGFGENANSTGLVIQALVMAGEDLSSADSSWMQQERSPQAALLAWQGESGAFQADFGDGGFDDFFSTVQSIPALSLNPPVAAEPTVVPTESVEPTAMPEPTAAPTETPLPPTAEPTTPPEPTAPPEPAATAVEALAEVENEPVIEESVQTDADSDGGGIDPWLAVIIGLGVITLTIAAAVYLWKNHD